MIMRKASNCYIMKCKSFELQNIRQTFIIMSGRGEAKSCELDNKKKEKSTKNIVQYYIISLHEWLYVVTYTILRSQQTMLFAFPSVFLNQNAIVLFVYIIHIERTIWRYIYKYI